MKAFTIILGIILVLVIAILLFAGWLGIFTKLSVAERMEGSYIVAGTDYKGDYSKVGMQAKNVEERLKAAGINCLRGFGIYYDDPKVTPKEKCRSFIGNIIEEKDYRRLEEMKKIGLRVDTIHKKQSLIVEFAYKNIFSFFIGPLKAYPLLSDYAKAKNFKPTLVWEMYDMPAKKILYIMQL